MQESRIHHSSELAEKANWRPMWSIEKYADTEAKLARDKALIASLSEFENRRVSIFLEGKNQILRFAELAAVWAKRCGCTLEESALAWLPTEFRLALSSRGKFAYDAHQFPGNALVYSGINEFWTLIAGTGGTLFNNANAYICVGTSSTAVTPATDTDLLGTSTRSGMEVAFPTYGSSQKATWKASFASGDGNHAWAEHAIANHATAGTIGNRKVEDEGTKTAGQVWVETLEVSLA